MPSPIPDEGKDFIRRVWYDLKQKGANTSYRSIYRAALSMQEANPNLKHIRLPGERMTSDIVSELNKRHGELPKGQRVQDEPWSLGSFDREDLPEIPLQSLPAIKRVWEICILADVSFTVRLVKWISRLDAWAPYLNPFNLYGSALEYSIKEFACAVAGIAFNTSVEDFSFHDAKKIDTFALNLLDATGRLPKYGSRDKILRDAEQKQSPYRNTWFCPLSEKDLVEAVHLPFDVYLGLDDKRQSLIETSRGLSRDFIEEIDGLSAEAKTAYTIWLPYVTKGPKWKSMSKEERLDIVLSLYFWADSQPWTVERSKFPHGIVWGKPQEVRPYQRAILPIEVLQQVGYDVTPTDVQPSLYKIRDIEDQL